MTDLIIRKLRASDSDKAAFLRFVRAWQKEDNPFLQRLVATFSEIDFDHFDEYVAGLRQAEKIAPDENSSTTSVYFAFVGSEIAGRIACRWQLEKGDLIKIAGNIGYSVVKDFRGQGITEKMLDFVLPKFKKRGIQQVMISALATNSASRHILEKMDARLENKFTIDKKIFCRYWLRS